MRWVVHVEHVGERGQVHTWVWWRNLKERENFKDLDIDEG
jgi:hypothetical protein